MQLERIGKYERLDHIGHGTTANVWLAKDPQMGRQVALKVVEPEATDLEPFFKEARLLARSQHPNIVTIHGSDLIDGKVVIDMEYVPGKTLRQLLKDEKQLSLDRALKIAAQILNALAYAHGMGVIHRDMKPANILIGPEDAVKVVDFGIADVLASQGYLAGAGTFSHMAPECFEDKSDRRSDLYSVGVILYEMLAGELPVQAERNTLTAWKEALDSQKKLKPLTAFLPSVPNGLQGIVSLALTHDKQKRFQTAEAFLDALKRNGFYALPNSEAELRLIDRFEAAYNRIDKHLRQELKADRKTGFADVVRQYAQQHPEWQSERDLLRLGRVRNELRHELMEADQYRFVPVTADIERLDEVAKNLGESSREQAKNRPLIIAEKVDALNSSKVAKSHPLPPNQTTERLNESKNKEGAGEAQPQREADHSEAPTQRGSDQAQLKRVMQELRFVPAWKIILNYDANGAVHYVGTSVFAPPGEMFAPLIRGTVLDATRSLENFFDEQREIQLELLEQQKQERIRKGLCTSCGESLGFKDKLCRRTHHDDPLCNMAHFHDEPNLAECWRKARHKARMV